MPFENCTAEEQTAFAKIVDGDSVENHDPAVVRSLVEKNLLDFYDGEHITVPAIVWNQWKHYLEEHPI